MKASSMSVQARLRSFGYALNGLASFFRREPNAWLHLVATLSVIILGALVSLSATEKMALVFVIGLVWVAELFNTCIEKLLDLISVQYHPRIKFIKDISAAAVLIAAITALATGFFVFLPKFF